MNKPGLSQTKSDGPSIKWQVCNRTESQGRIKHFLNLENREI